MATGKSTVSNMFRDLGVPVIDADAMARRIVEPGRSAWRAIKWVMILNYSMHMHNLQYKMFRNEFGQGVFHDNGELNRAALRTIIFEVLYSLIRKRKALNIVFRTRTSAKS